MSETRILTNGQIVTARAVLEGGSVVIVDERIVEVTARTYPGGAGVLDLGGRLLLPGLVDLHNDALEREINPRPNANFEPAFALAHLDRKLSAAGVTTQFHAISFADRAAFGRSVAHAAGLCQAVQSLNGAPHATIDNLVLHRLDLRTAGALDQLLAVAETAPVPLVSLNDHVPGQGQYRDLAAFRGHLRPYLERSVDEAELDAILRQRIARASETEVVMTATLQALAARQRQRPLILASHDDDTPERVELMHALGCTIAEFPVTLAAAGRANALGLQIAMGAPNVLRGGSLTGNASALDLLARGLCHILVADYHAPALLAAVFKVVELNVTDLPAAVRLVSANPAAAVGLGERGRIAAGQRADLIVVERPRAAPLVAATLVAGQLRYLAGPFAVTAASALGQRGGVPVA